MRRLWRPAGRFTTGEARVLLSYPAMPTTDDRADDQHPMRMLSPNGTFVPVLRALNRLDHTLAAMAQRGHAQRDCWARHRYKTHSIELTACLSMG